ncbi:uncharacterized protein B0I36DRAFT_337139, partial [Microdochium trichocladiopsis]
MAKSRRIALYWELEAEEHRFWVREFMDEMLALDTYYRITLCYTSMGPESIIQTELSIRKGRTLVSRMLTNSTNPPSRFERERLGRRRRRENVGLPAVVIL